LYAIIPQHIGLSIPVVLTTLFSQQIDISGITKLLFPQQTAVVKPFLEIILFSQHSDKLGE
jgi:hypothetical protein